MNKEKELIEKLFNKGMCDESINALECSKEEKFRFRSTLLRYKIWAEFDKMTEDQKLWLAYHLGFMNGQHGIALELSKYIKEGLTLIQAIEKEIQNW